MALLDAIRGSQDYTLLEDYVREAIHIAKSLVIKDRTLLDNNVQRIRGEFITTTSVLVEGITLSVFRFLVLGR